MSCWLAMLYYVSLVTVSWAVFITCISCFLIYFWLVLYVIKYLIPKSHSLRTTKDNGIRFHKTTLFLTVGYKPRLPLNFAQTLSRPHIDLTHLWVQKNLSFKHKVRCMLWWNQTIFFPSPSYVREKTTRLEDSNTEFIVWTIWGTVHDTETNAGKVAKAKTKNILSRQNALCICN